MNLHIKIIKYLFFSSVAIALFVAIFTLSIQLNNIEDRVLLLAKNEIKYFIREYKISHTENQMELNLSQTNFLLIRVLDNHGTTILEKAVGDIKNILYELAKIDHHLVTKESETVKQTVIHNQVRNRFYLQFKAPLVLKDFEGSIEGLYEVSDDEMQKIYMGIFYSVMRLVLTVFVTTLFLYPVIVYFNHAYIRQTKKLLQANLEIMSVLGGAIAKRDNETNMHNYRVTLYAIALGKAMSLPGKEMMGLIKGAFLHDVGKIGIDDSILLKPGKLTFSEFEEMKRHVEFGIDIISKSKWLDDAKDVVAYHHEKWDGTGYNNHISAEQIPLTARIFMICDVFDALTSKRPYKEAMSFETSMNIIKEKSGNHFDPELTEVFYSIIKAHYLKISQVEDEEKLHAMLDDKLQCFTSDFCTKDFKELD